MRMAKYSSSISTGALCGSGSSTCSVFSGWVVPDQVRCTASSSPPTVVRARLPPPSLPPFRRSGNYQPSSWDDESIPSLKGGYMSEAQITHVGKLKENVKQLMHDQEAEPAANLKLVDALQRFGVAYHFEEEIKDTLDSISLDKAKIIFKEDVLSMTLLFRLLRENGFTVSEDLLSGFKDVKGNFKPYLQNNVTGLLSLYEASCLGFEGERLLDEARIFATTHLNELKPHMDPNLKAKVAHALELPLHWRNPRLEARWYIDHCKRDEHVESVVLQLAMLDFNRVQSIYQEELGRVSRWWKDVALGKKLAFARDRIMECFFSSTGIVFEPHYGYCRESLAKVGAFVTVIDDVYDVYGTLDELTLFTITVERWESDAMEGLPDYMKTLYSTLYNTTNEMANHMFNEVGWDALPYLKKAWHDLCKAFLVEAKWHHSDHKPTLEEYLENGWMSSSGNVVLLHAFALLGEKATIHAPQILENYPELVRSSSLILRLCNDLATYAAEREKGDAPSSIDCYMREHGTNEEGACEAIRDLIIETWKKVNREAYNRCPLPRSFANSAINLGRISHCLYLNGDGIGAPNQEKKNQVKSLFLEPIIVEGSENNIEGLI